MFHLFHYFKVITWAYGSEHTTYDNLLLASKLSYFLASKFGGLLGIRSVCSHSETMKSDFQIASILNEFFCVDKEAYLSLLQIEKSVMHIFLCWGRMQTQIQWVDLKKKIMTGFLCNGTRVKCMEKSGGVFESNLNNGIVYIYFKAEKK